MKNLGWILLLLLGTTLPAAAQESFTADRPGASTGPATVSRGVFQLEQGLQYDGGDEGESFTFSNTLFRYGVLKGFELRLGGDLYLQDKECYFTGLNLGTKIALFEGQGAIPAISVLAQCPIPGTMSDEIKVDKFAPSLYLLFENPLSDRLSLGYNVGAEWSDIQKRPTAFVALCLGISLTDRLGCFVENYNYFHADGNAYFADWGINYMLCDRLQLDIAANIDLKAPSRSWAVNMGVAWQINRP